MMDSLKQAVLGIFVFKKEVFVIKRQAYLSDFPGYTSFPGGKIEQSDLDNQSIHPLFECFKSKDKGVVSALCRELKEELRIDLIRLFEKKYIRDIFYLGFSKSPELFKSRFLISYIVIDLKHKIDFELNVDEIKSGQWLSFDVLERQLKLGQHLVVEVFNRILQTLKKRALRKIVSKKSINFSKKPTQNNHLLRVFIFEGIEMIYVPSLTLPPPDFTFCFNIKLDCGTHLLIDPAPKDDYNFKALKNTLKGESVSSIFISHAHRDHYLFSNVLAKELGANISLSEETYHGILKRKGNSFFKGVDIRFLDEGDCIGSWLGKQIEVIKTPGHAFGQLSLMLENKQWCFISDVIYPPGSVVVENMGDYYKSLDRLLNLNPMFLLLSHYMPISGIYFIQEAKKRRLKREAEIKYLYDKGFSQDAILKVLYPKLSKTLMPFAKSMIFVHLEHALTK